MRLLLAEDEEMMADAVIAFLTYYGHQVDWDKDGKLYSLYRDSSQTYIEFYTQIR